VNFSNVSLAQVQKHEFAAIFFTEVGLVNVDGKVIVT